jgi:hypothetical protein
VVWFLIQLINAGAVSNDVQTGGVAYLAHIGIACAGTRSWSSRVLQRRL